jgi:hypothetical protein
MGGSTKSNLISMPRVRQEFHRTFQNLLALDNISPSTTPRSNIQTVAMPGPSNTLLIEGSFSELAEELAQYLDPLHKAEAGAGLEAEIKPTLQEIREKEEAEEPSDPDLLRKQKDEVLKKLVGKANVLNSAPEKGIHFVFYLGGLY